MFKLATVLLCLCVPLGCDSGDAKVKADAKVETTEEKKRDSTATAVTKADATSGGPLFDKEIRKRACEFLTPDMVAEVAGVDVGAIEQRTIGGMCGYKWEGGEAWLGHMQASKTVEFAHGSFESAYADKTGEDIEKAFEQIDKEVEKKNEEGKSAVELAKAKRVSGALGKGLATGFQYEDVAGLGDAARFENTKNEHAIAGKTIVNYANTLHVLIRNLKYTVFFNRKGEPKLYKDENIALAKAVLAKLEG